MSNLKFIHAADLHLDTPFTGYSKVDEDLARDLQDASIDALRKITDVAIDEEVDLVVFAGDIYDGAHRGLRAQIVFKRELERLGDNGIRAFVIHGNHDPLDGWLLIRQFPENTHVFGSQVESVEVEKDGEVVATVHGVSYGENHVHENLASGFRATSEGFQIGLLHTEVGNPSSHYAPCSLNDLIDSGIEYWALGHIHTRAELLKEPRVVYPGNHQGRSFNEEGPRGVSLVTVRDGRIAAHEFVEVDQWRFETVRVDIAGCDDVADVEATIHAEIEQVEGDCARIVRVRLEGRSHLHEALATSAMDELLRTVRDSTASLRPRVWLARIEDDMRPDFDVEAIREQDDFLSEIVEMADEGMPDLGEFEPTPKTHLSTFRRYIGDDVDDEQVVVEQARDLALELLMNRGEV